MEIWEREPGRDVVIMQGPPIRGRTKIIAGLVVALVLGAIARPVAWLVYPHMNVTIYNESSAAIRDVRLSSFYGVRTAARIEPGGYATTAIQSSGESGVFLSYRDASGSLKSEEAVYYSPSTASPDRGNLEIRITDGGTRVVEDIDLRFDGLSPVTLRQWPWGGMTVRSRPTPAQK